MPEPADLRFTEIRALRRHLEEAQETNVRSRTFFVEIRCVAKEAGYDNIVELCDAALNHDRSRD